LRAGGAPYALARPLAKLGLVVEELDETAHWLSVLTDAGIAAPPQNLITECRELLAITSTAVTTARRTSSRNS